jgi:multimeric flavodoxin WrbA
MANSKIKAIFLNCSLKKSPTPSNTEVLMNKIVDLMTPNGVECEMIRVVDYNIAYGVSSDEGDGDEWPILLKKIKQANIIIIGSPIWFGVRSSVCQLILERLDGTYMEGDKKTGQFPLYGKVGGVVATGNEDGAHDVCSNTLFNLSHLGCTIPPNSDCYYVGNAGPGPSYIEEGQCHMYTLKTARMMATNLVFFAKLLQKTTIPTNLKQIYVDAEKASKKCQAKSLKTTRKKK